MLLLLLMMMMTTNFAQRRRAGIRLRSVLNCFRARITLRCVNVAALRPSPLTDSPHFNLPPPLSPSANARYIGWPAPPRALPPWGGL